MDLATAIVGAAPIAVAVTFFVAAIGKVSAGRELRRAVAAYRVFGEDPDSARVVAIAVALPIAEFALGVTAILWTRDRWLLALVGIGLLMGFSAAMVSAIRRHEPIQCSCFGLTSGSRSDPVSWRHVTRNGILALLFLLAIPMAPASVWTTHGIAAFATVQLAGLCIAGLLMELPTVLTVAFSPPPHAPEHPELAT